MKIQQALKTLEKHNIHFNDFFDLVGIETRDSFLKVAIERVKTFITIGK